MSCCQFLSNINSINTHLSAQHRWQSRIVCLNVLPEKLCIETSLAGSVETYATACWQTPKSLMRWLAIFVVSHFLLCWLVNIRLLKLLLASSEERVIFSQES